VSIGSGGAMSTIAVSERGSIWRLPNFKASLLSFDKIYIPQGQSKIDRKFLELELHGLDISLSDIEYLEKEGIISQNPINDKYLVGKSLDEIKKFNKRYGVNEHTFGIFASYLERYGIEELEKQSSDTFIPLSPLTFTSRNLSVCDDADVFSLIIENMPILSDQVPLDEVLSFKREHQSDYQRLLNWITHSHNRTNNIDFLKEEINEMVENFRSYKRIGELKFQPGKVEVLFTGLAIFRDSFTFRFGSVSRTIATLRKEKASLIEHELKSPARPLSYIVKAQDCFERQ